MGKHDNVMLRRGKTSHKCSNGHFDLDLKNRADGINFYHQRSREPWKHDQLFSKRTFLVCSSLLVTLIVWSAEEPLSSGRKLLVLELRELGELRRRLSAMRRLSDMRRIH